MKQSLNGDHRSSVDWIPPRVSDAIVSERPDPLAVRSLRVGLFLLVEAHGKLDRDTVAQLTSALQSAQTVTGMLVDLSGVTAIDGVAAGSLAGEHERLEWDGKQMALLCPPGDVRHVLEDAGVTHLVPAFVDPGAAIDAASSQG